VRVLDRSNGRQLWNVSLAQYDIELTPHTPSSAAARGPPLRAALELHPHNRLCAAAAPDPGSSGSAGGSGAGAKGNHPCRWSRAFGAPLAFVYLLDTSRGTHQLLQFAMPDEHETDEGVLLLVPPETETRLVPAADGASAAGGGNTGGATAA